MITRLAVLVLIASFLFLAPVLESGPHVRVFQAVGNAAEGAGD